MRISHEAPYQALAGTLRRDLTVGVRTGRAWRCRGRVSVNAAKVSCLLKSRLASAPQQPKTGPYSGTGKATSSWAW